MNDFERTLIKFADEADGLKKREVLLQRDKEMFGEKFGGFLKENGLPENFSMTEWATLAIRKSRELIRP